MKRYRTKTHTEPHRKNSTVQEHSILGYYRHLKTGHPYVTKKVYARYRHLVSHAVFEKGMCYYMQHWKVYHMIRTVLAQDSINTHLRVTRCQTLHFL
jgi:hypothetical protein